MPAYIQKEQNIIRNILYDHYINFQNKFKEVLVLKNILIEHDFYSKIIWLNNILF